MHSILSIGRVCLCGAALAALPLACKQEAPPTTEPQMGFLVTDAEPSSRAPAPDSVFPVNSAEPSRELPENAATEPGSGACLLSPADRVRSLNGTRYEITRTALTGAVSELSTHPKRWLRAGVLAWVSAPQGKRLLVSGLEPGADCGFQNGDLVTSIQGIALADPHAAEKLKRALPDAPEVRVKLERAGKPMTFTFQVVERLL